MTPLYARAPRGERAHGSAPGGWPRAAGPGRLARVERAGDALRRRHDRGHEHPGGSIQAATTTRMFLAFLQAVLIPELRRCHPGATVLMDNLSAHKPKAIEAALATAGSSSFTCRATRPTSRPSNPAGPSSRAPCRPPRRARPTRSKPLSRPPSTTLPPPTHAAGSTIAVTHFQTDVKTALRLAGISRRGRSVRSDQFEAGAVALRAHLIERFAVDEIVKVFGDIGRMVADTLDVLRHE